MERRERIKASATALVIYGMTFVISLFGPEFAKAIVTGSSGANTRFVATAVLCPIAFLLLGFFGGRRRAALHIVLLVMVAIWSWVAYPENPPMNFARQIAHDLPPGLGVMYLAGALFSVPFDGRRKRSRTHVVDISDNLRSLKIIP